MNPISFEEALKLQEEDNRITTLRRVKALADLLNLKVEVIEIYVSDTERYILSTSSKDNVFTPFSESLVRNKESYKKQLEYIPFPTNGIYRFDIREIPERLDIPLFV